MTKSERILLFILAAINFTNIMDFMVMMPLAPELKDVLHISTTQFGYVVAAYAISAFLSGLISTFIINRFERKRFLTSVYIGFTIGTFACGFAGSYEMLLLARFFTGFFGGILGAIVLSIVGDNIPLERRGHAMGIIMAAFSFASVFGVPFGTYVALDMGLGWNAPFLALGVLCIPIYFLVLRFVPRQTLQLETSFKQSWDTVKTILTTRNSVYALLLGCVIVLGHFSIIPYLSPYMTQNVGLAKTDIKWIYFVGGGATIFTSPLVGKLADRFGKYKTFVVFVFLYLIPVYLVTNMHPVGMVYLLSVSAIFFVFSSGRFIPSQAMVTGAITPQVRGSFMSFNSSMQQLAMGLASVIAGLIITEENGKLVHYDWVGYLAMGMALISLAVAAVLRTADGKKF